MLALSILVWHMREKCIVLLLQVFAINIKLVQILDYCLRLYILSPEKKGKSLIFIHSVMSHSIKSFKV